MEGAGRGRDDKEEVNKYAYARFFDFDRYDKPEVEEPEMVAPETPPIAAEDETPQKVRKVASLQEMQVWPIEKTSKMRTTRKW